MRDQNIRLRILAVSALWQGANDYAFVRAFRRAGHSVRALSEDESFPQWQGAGLRVLRRLLSARIARDFNRRLLLEARQIRPDLLFVFKGSLVFAETLHALRRMGTITIQFYPDTGFRVHSPYLLDALPHYDWVFSTKPEHPEALHRRLGMSNVSFLPHAFDPETHQPVQTDARDRAEYACDLSFVGAVSPKKRQMLDALARAVPALDLRIWGPSGWAEGTGPAAKAYQGRPVWGLEYAKVIALSRINLGLLFEGNSDGSGPDVITARSFEIPGAGGFMLHERTDQAMQFFADEAECAYFSEPEELIEKTRQFLADEPARSRIAQAGHQRALGSGYATDDRCRTILQKYHALRAAG